MRWLFGSCLLAASFYFLMGVAEEVALLAWGTETKAYIQHVSSQSSRRGTRYEAFYEFETLSKTLAHGRCPTHKGTQGKSLRIVYLEAKPSVNRPDKDWYGYLLLSGYLTLGYLLCLWAARVYIRKPKRLGGYPEEKGAFASSSTPADLHAGKATKRWRNRWSSALYLASVLCAVLVLLGLLSLANAMRGFWSQFEQSQGTLPAETTGVASDKVAAPVSLPTEHFGNTPGNAANDNLFATDGETLFLAKWRNYDNPGAPGPGLYRARLKDGGELSLVGRPGDTETIYRGIQVREGWLYYKAMQGLHRLRLDGSKHKVLTKDDALSMAVVGDWIYYQIKWDKDRLWRMQLDGSSPKRLTDEAVGCLSIGANGYIYYVNKTDSDRLYRIRHDGSERRKISDRKVSLLIAGDRALWFIDADSGQLGRMNLQGENPEIIVEDKVGSANLSGDWVYFSRTGGLARCRHDGSEMEPLTNLETWQFCILKDRVYFQDTDGHRNFSIGVDGSDLKEF